MDGTLWKKIFPEHRTLANFPHPQIKDFHGGGLVDDGFLLLRVAPCFTKLGGGAGGGQGFIDKDERDRWQAFPKLIREGTDLGGGASLAAVHTERQADNERVDLSDFYKPGDPLDGIAFALVDGFHRVRKDAEVVGRGDADPRIAMIDAERGMRGV